MAKYLVLLALLSISITVSYGHPVAGTDSPSTFIESLGIDKLFKLATYAQSGDLIKAAKILLNSISDEQPFSIVKEALLKVLNAIEPFFDDFFNIKDELGNEPQHFQIITIAKKILQQFTGTTI